MKTLLLVIYATCIVTFTAFGVDPSPTATATATPILWGKVPRGTDISTNTGWHITDGKLTPPTPTATATATAP